MRGRPEGSPIRVLRVIARLNMGGPALHVTYLARGLASRGYETTLVAGDVARGEESMAFVAERAGVEIVPLPGLSRELSPLRDAVAAWRVAQIIRRVRPDIVHTHTAKAGAAGRAAGFLYRWLTRRDVRFVHTYHGHIFHSYYGRLKTRLFLFIEKALARTTDVIIVLSEQQRKEIHETFGVGRAEQFRIIPLGIDLAEFGGVVRASGAPSVIGLAGRLTQIKNHDLFLRVAARFRDTNLRFVIYGDGTERAAIAPRAAELGVVLAGTRPAAEIYSSIDIAALTSLNEGTPLTLIEAMANGLPVISTAVGGVVDLLGDVKERVSEDGAVYEIRERGITAASNDDAGFAAGLRRLLADADLRRSFGEKGRAFAHATYSKERLIADMIRLYRGLRT